MNEELKMENSSNQEFCLKWNNFPNNFMSQFEALKEDEDFVDVTLYCCGQCIKAHKVVLSACSPYLKNIFKEHPCKHPIIILDNLSFNNLEAVIQFVYTGQVYIEQTELSSFLKAAKILQISGLTESNTQKLIEKNISQTDAFQVNANNQSNPSKKRESELEIESKRLKTKKVIRRVSAGCAKENNEFYDDQKSKEKDWCVTSDKFEESAESSSLNVNIVEHGFESDGKLVNNSSNEDEFCSEDLKRPHWLDPRSCPLCNRTYSNLSNLRQHMKLIHNPTFVTCKLCNKTFKTDLYLRRHISSYHEVSLTGNGNNLMPVEPYFKQIQSQPTEWNSNIKLEPDGFHEVFSSNEMYHVQQ